MLFTALVDVSTNIGATTSRNEKIARLCEWLRRLSPAEITIGVHYLSGRLPQGRIGVGHALLRGEIAPAAQSTLQIRDVDEVFAAIVATSGSGATAARSRQLRALFERATRSERDFLVRLLIGELRQGALEGIMVEAVARAASVPIETLQRATMLAGDLGIVAVAALTRGGEGLERFRLRPMQPIRPMLAQPAQDVETAIADMGEVAFEYKLDGARLQIHKVDDAVRVYSRRLKDVTASVPDLVEIVRRLPASQLILDGEAIALARDGRPLPFQNTMRRFGRKQEVERLRAELPLSAFFFDCLHRDGEDVIDQPGAERFRVSPELLIPRRVSADADEAKAFLAEALAKGHEGLLVKSLHAPYEAGNRGAAWRKLKGAHTLDLVVLAAEWGHGRRRGWLSNLHLGARDPASGGFVMLGKTFKGMTDAMLVWQTERLQALAVERDAYTVYVRPALVVEIAFNGIQASPHYPGGFALRFARVKRYREDKTPAEADTIDTARAIYANQSGVERN
jgi:ATP-dependent DNA ligase I